MRSAGNLQLYSRLREILKSLRVSAHSTLLCMVVLSSVLSFNAWADPGFDPKPRESLKREDVRDAIDAMHAGAGNLLNGFASQIDRYFAEDVIPKKINDTTATVRFDASDSGTGDLSARTRLKLRLVLPRTEQRLRLLLDVDDEDSNDDTRSTVEELSDPEEDRDLSLALRFIRQIRTDTEFKADIGARRFEQRLQSFVRLRVDSELEREDGWSFKFINDLRFFQTSSYVNRLSFDFWRPLGRESLNIFRTSTSFDWRRSINGARIDQTIGVYRELKYGSLLAFEALTGLNTSTNGDIENHFDGLQLQIRYRKNLFRPWFHFEVWPGINFLPENDNEPQFSGLLRVEVQLGE